jgi:cytochrome oxidase Cu insertion factor (SCO1/SenC/PrrC family)
MVRARGQYVVWGVILLALVGLAAAAWLTSPPGKLATAGTRGGVLEDAASPTPELDDFGVVPDFALVSQTGDSVHLADLAGQVWIGDFIFTNCASSCPMMTLQLQKLQAALAGETRVRLVSFSVDPERDTPAKLAEYAANYGADPERWLFLTGEKAAIRSLSYHGFHLPTNDPTPEDLARGAEAVLHSTRFALVDPHGHIRGYYDGNDPAALDKLHTHVRRLIADIGS